MGSIQLVVDFAKRVADNVETVIVGKRKSIELAIVAMLVQGHILIEDVPGIGKTMLARALAASLGIDFNRLQCTPDLMPNDITGVNIFNQQSGSFEFRQGPVFVNVLLADEINRATPRAQAALLEAMQEQQVTIDGITYRLPVPFLVLATQNPVELEGTFPLPEAQLDRFLMRISMGYPQREEEIQILRNLRKQHPIESVRQVVDGLELVSLHEPVSNVYVDETLEHYIMSIVEATRTHADLALGASPRGSLALYKCGQALAALHGRDYVTPDDVKLLAPYTLCHRLIIKPESQLRGHSPESVLRNIITQTELHLDRER
ncbi:MAG: MoxR family ATPase [Anaerolineae bacterium]|nr:MoxR family ATPase [Anaerolineae bacterium]